MSSLVKSIITFVAIVLVAYLGFLYVTRNVSTPAADSTDTAHVSVVTSTSTNSETDEFAVLLEDLSVVDFQGNSSIFTNEIFQAGLTSFRRDLPTIDRDRVNPFAPLDGTAATYIHYNTNTTSLKATATTTAKTATTTVVKTTATSTTVGQ